MITPSYHLATFPAAEITPPGSDLKASPQQKMHYFSVTYVLFAVIKSELRVRFYPRQNTPLCL